MTSAVPNAGFSLSAPAIVGRRRSASIRITRTPPWASAKARLIAVVVLPSDGEEPVTRKARATPSERLDASVVRSLR